MLAIQLLLSCATSFQSTAAAAPDPRASYDVLAYRLDLDVDPAHQRIAGWSFVEARALAPLDRVVLDMQATLTAHEVRYEGDSLAPREAARGALLAFTHDGDRLVCTLPARLDAGRSFVVAVKYDGHPGPRNSFDGVHWNKTADGRPWIGTSSQGTGAAYWWPCKDSFFHPEDKPARLFVNATVPADLYAVSNGRLQAIEDAGDARRTFRWRHDYPLETYAVTLNVAPYVVVESKLELAGLTAPLDFIYYALPESAAKAAVQFADVPRLLETYGEAFGPFPFPGSKFALVETSFWGMEHSTAVAYGSSFPAWCRQNGVKDRYALRNTYFDYILVHEVAHEWWGNAVSAADWGDFWIHEGFGTYAEGVFVERTQGRERADEYWRDAQRQVDKRGSLFRGMGTNSDQAYDGILYAKGGWVLHTLRTFVADDDAWWKTLRDFNLAFRYRNASTDDFRAVLERNTGRPWSEFFDEWFRGNGYPLVDGGVRAATDELTITAESTGSDGTSFHVPLDLTWKENGSPKSARVVLAPGANTLHVATHGTATEVVVTNLDRMLGRFTLRVDTR